MLPIHNSDLSSYKSRPLDRDVVSLPDPITNRNPSTISRRSSQEGADSFQSRNGVMKANEFINLNKCGINVHVCITSHFLSFPKTRRHNRSLLNVASMAMEMLIPPNLHLFLIFMVKHAFWVRIAPQAWVTTVSSTLNK